MAARRRFDRGAGARADRAHGAPTPGAALPILHDLQHRFGYIDDAAIALIADALNISKAEALGVVSFYHDFRRAPVDGRVLKLCRAESCQAMGCEDLVAHLETRPWRRPSTTASPARAARRDRLLPRQLRALARRAARRRADRPARPRPDRRHRRRRQGAGRDERADFRSPRFVGAVGRRRRGRAGARARSATRAASTSTIVRTGSRGLFWLEPLVEVETPQGRVGYGPVAAERRRARCSTRVS